MFSYKTSYFHNTQVLCIVWYKKKIKLYMHILKAIVFLPEKWLIKKFANSFSLKCQKTPQSEVNNQRLKAHSSKYGKFNCLAMLIAEEVKLS